MQEVTEQMRNFLQFITLQFITKPDQAQLRVAEANDKENHIRFRLIVAQQDVAILIGKNGFTASAIRNVLKAAALREGCLLYTSPSPRDLSTSRMPSSA